MREVSLIGSGVSQAGLLLELKNRPFIVFARKREDSFDRIESKSSGIEETELSELHSIKGFQAYSDSDLF